MEEEVRDAAAIMSEIGDLIADEMLDDDAPVQKNSKADKGDADPTLEADDDGEADDTDRVKEDDDDDDDYLLDEDEDDEADTDDEEDQDQDDDEEGDDYVAQEIKVNGEVLYNINAKFESKEDEKNFKDLVKNAQTAKANTQVSQDLAKQKKDFSESKDTHEWLGVQKEQHKAHFKVAETQDRVDVAQKALDDGFYMEGDNKKELSINQIKETEKNIRKSERWIKEEKEKMTEAKTKVLPPRFEDLKKKLPDFFNDKDKHDEYQTKWIGMMQEAGYTEQEIKTMDDPRRILELEELHELRELRKKVDAARSKRKAKMTTKTTRSNGKSSSKRKSKRTVSGDDRMRELAKNGDMNAISEMFSEFV